MALTEEDVVLAAREKFPDISTALDEGQITSANVVEAMSERFPEIGKQLVPQEATTQPGELEQRISGDPLEQLKGQLEGKSTEEAGRLLGGFQPISPAIQGYSAFEKSIDEGKDFGEALRKGLIVAGADAAVTFLGGKLLKITGKGLASLKAKGLSQKVSKKIFENPELALKPKQPWQEIKNRALQDLNGKKRKIGRTLGALKKQAKADNVNLAIKNQPTIDKLDDLLTQISPEAKSERKIVQRMKDIIKGDNVGKELVDVSIEQADDMLRDADSVVGMNDIFNKNNLPEQFGGISPAEGAVLKARGIVKEMNDELIDQIPETGKRIKDLKGQYRDLFQVKAEFRNLNKSNIGNKLESAMRRNNEEAFDLLDKHLPKDRFNQVIANIVNKEGASLPKVGGRVGVIREAVGAIEEVASKAGGIIGGKKPPFSIGTLPRAGFAAKEPVGVGAKLGLVELLRRGI